MPWRGPEDNEWTYYPSPITRRPPWWAGPISHPINFLPEGAKDVGALLKEIYIAVSGGQHRLAAMGIRALLEQIMINKIADHGTFARNLEIFHSQGYISLAQRDAISAILDVGHAAAHRGFKPSGEDLETALDIAEGLIAAIFIQPGSAEELADRVPARSRKRP